MDLLEFWRSELVGVALVDFDVVVDFAFFEQPEDALRTGLFEPDAVSTNDAPVNR